MIGQRGWARQARTVVAGTGSGEIVPGAFGHPAAPARVGCGVVDHDGEPILAVRPEALCVLGRKVRLDLRPLDDTDVSLVGRVVAVDFGTALADAGRWEAKILHAYHVDGSAFLRLCVDAVMVGRTDSVARRSWVGLDEYALADPDIVRAHGPRIMTHLNHAHPEPIAAAAAQVLGVTPDQLIGARLSGMDSAGVEISVVDPSGGRTAVVPFARPVHDIDELVEALRSVLAREVRASRKPTR
jgi:hypothetical protein